MMCCFTRRNSTDTKFKYENGTCVYASNATEALNKLMSPPKIISCTPLKDKVWTVSFDKDRYIDVEDCKDLQNARQKATWRLYLDKRDPSTRP
jgi:hypothetical protein